jgi:hypothetical protein
VDLKGEETLEDGDLSFKAGWVPERLVFVSEGRAPYTLAYGSAVVRKAKAGGDAIAQLQDSAGLQRGRATLGEPKVLGGKDRLIPPPPAPPSAKEIWGKRAGLTGMVLATLLLGWMAYRLARQMGVANR